MEKIHKNMHVLRFHVNFKHKQNMHVGFPFSVYFYPITSYLEIITLHVITCNTLTHNSGQP